MAKTRSMTRNQNRDDASSRKRITSCDNSDEAPWSDLDHHLLFLVMMQLGLIDYLAFGGVCKSWRSLALANKKIFMESRPPMLMSISDSSCEKECYLEDFEDRKFKTILPHSDGRTCVGSTCGYLILFGEETHDFWLVNPITRHQLHFPCTTFLLHPFPDKLRAILVFSPSINRWVFVVLLAVTYNIWFSIAGTQTWNHVSFTTPLVSIHAFKGKIYAIDMDNLLCEIRLDPEPKLTFLETKNFPKSDLLYQEFVSLGENLHLMQIISEDLWKLHELDFGEMKWVSQEKATGKYAFFLTDYKFCAAIKLESWADHPRTQYERHAFFLDSLLVIRQKCRFFCANMWYLPHVNLIDEG